MHQSNVTDLIQRNGLVFAPKVVILCQEQHAMALLHTHYEVSTKLLFAQHYCRKYNGLSDSVLHHRCPAVLMHMHSLHVTFTLRLTSQWTDSMTMCHQIHEFLSQTDITQEDTHWMCTLEQLQ